MIKLKDFRRIVLLIAISLLLQIEVLEAFLIPSSFSSKLTHNIRLNPYRRPLAPLKSTDQPLINGNIQFDEVRLILAGSNGEPDEMIGIVSIDDALEKAEELELDLVCINENADPPVCKIIDYGKYRYEIEKRKKENMKKQAKAGDLKEIKMSYHIEQHDFDVRIRQIKKFVADGDRVKVTVIFKGREMQNTKLGADLLNRVFETVSSVAVMESPPTIEGRSMLMMVGPKKKGQ